MTIGHMRHGHHDRVMQRSAIMIQNKTTDQLPHALRRQRRAFVLQHAFRIGRRASDQRARHFHGSFGDLLNRPQMLEFFVILNATLQHSIVPIVIQLDARLLQLMRKEKR